MTGPRRGLRRLAASAGVLALLLSQLALAAPGRPAQAPIFAAASTQPNILIVIDDSGSMRERRAGSKKVPMQAAKDAAILMLESLSNVRVGVASFRRGDHYDPVPYGGAQLDHEIVDLDKNRAAIYKTIDSLSPLHWTPLARTLEEVGRYFIGLGGPTNPGNSDSASCTKNGQYKGPLTLHPDSNPSKADVTKAFPGIPTKGDWKNSPAATAESPICHFCQKNFVILLTDGEGQGQASTTLQDYCPNCVGPGELVRVAAALYDIDLRPDIDDFDGKEVKNNVVTYTIGFHTSQPLLKLAAEKGGGDYFEADNEEKLKEAFAKIGEDITARAVGSAAAASFSTSTLSTDTAIYLTKFDTETWTGDVVATRLDPKTAKPQKKPLWQAAEQLDKATANGRVMLTYNNLAFAASQCPSPAKGSKTGGPVAFRWDKLSQAQQQDLLTGTGGGGGGTNFTFEKGFGIYSYPWARFKGITADDSGNVYAADDNSSLIRQFDSSGSLLDTWALSRGVNNPCVGCGCTPIGLDKDKDGYFYVACYGTHEIQKLDSKGNLVLRWGLSGNGAGQLNSPNALAVSPSGTVYVADALDRVQMFSSTTGQYKGKFGDYYTRGLTVDANNNVYIADTFKHQILKLDSSGKLLDKWGSYGSGDGQFKYPFGIAVDGSGNVYVVEYHGHRVQKFDSSGKFIDKWGS